MHDPVSCVQNSKLTCHSKEPCGTGVLSPATTTPRRLHASLGGSDGRGQLVGRDGGEGAVPLEIVATAGVHHHVIVLVVLLDGQLVIHLVEVVRLGKLVGYHRV